MATIEKTSGISGNWLDKGSVSNGMRIKIMSEVKDEPSNFPDKNGNPGRQYVGKVRVSGTNEDVNCGFNRPTLNGLVDAFGKESKEWVGKVCTAEVETGRQGGKRTITLYLIPEGFELVNDANDFAVIVKKGEKVSTPPLDEEEIKAADIPF